MTAAKSRSLSLVKAASKQDSGNHFDPQTTDHSSQQMNNL
jgi:hypothetical protein